MTQAQRLEADRQRLAAQLEARKPSPADCALALERCGPRARPETLWGEQMFARFEREMRERRAKAHEAGRAWIAEGRDR